MVLQYIPISIFIWIVTCITVATGSYCATSNNPHFAHIWLTVIKTISTVLAVLACLRFYKMKKTQLSPHKVMLKFIAFKGLIGLNIIQTVCPFLVSYLDHLLTCQSLSSTSSLATRQSAHPNISPTTTSKSDSQRSSSPAKCLSSPSFSSSLSPSLYTRTEAPQLGL